MDGTVAVMRYWCYRCEQIINPIGEAEMVQCPLCEGGFVEEMASSESREDPDPFSEFVGGGGGSESDRALSLWAPILLGMMSNPRHRRRFRPRLEFDGEDDDYEENENNQSQREQHNELDRELVSIMRRRRRSSATILQLLEDIRDGMLSESDNNGSENRYMDRNSGENREADREHSILINPFDHSITVQDSYDSDSSQNRNRQHHIGSLGDYFMGPGLDLLLQHLAENDPNRYGTPPAQKEVVEAMPTVNIEENLQCSVCLEDFEIGKEAKEMPCKHKFHNGCILPWLELHSSCPVCRYQLPSDECELDRDEARSRSNTSVESNNADGSGGEDWSGRNGNGRRFSMPLPWPLSSLFSSGNNGSGNPTSSSHMPTSSASSSSLSAASGSSSTTNAPGSASHTNEN